MDWHPETNVAAGAFHGVVTLVNEHDHGGYGVSFRWASHRPCEYQRTAVSHAGQIAAQMIAQRFDRATVAVGVVELWIRLVEVSSA